MVIKPKNTVQMRLDAKGQTHARTVVKSRDVTAIIDEPEIRGGTNLGLSPTETMMSSLIGCTNVISHRIAHKMDIRFEGMEISLTADFNRLGTMLAEEIEHPFSDIVLDITVKTDASVAQMQALQRDLAKFCPIAKVMRNSGISITENWTTTPIETAQ